MQNKNYELQKMFCEMDEAINVEELMEVKGGYDPPPLCGDGSTGVSCSSGGGVCIGGGV